MNDLISSSAPFYPKVPNISLELTNRCNLKCPYCGNSELTRRTGYIEWSLLEKIVSECANGYHNIAWLHGTGEPLMWDRLEDVIRLIKENRAGEVSFATNGTLLKKKRIVSLLDAGLKSIYVSLDTLDPVIYKNTRGAKLSSVVKNIQNLISIAPSDFKITIAMMDHKGQMLNDDHVQAFYSTFGKSENVNLTIVGNTLFPSAPQDYRISQTKMTWCTLPRTYFTIVLDGRVSICCVDQDVKYCLGDVNKQTIDEVWFDSKNQDTFRRIAAGIATCPDVCTKNCSLQERVMDSSTFRWPSTLTMGFDAAVQILERSIAAGETERASAMLNNLRIRNPASTKVAHFDQILQTRKGL